MINLLNKVLDSLTKAYDTRANPIDIFGLNSKNGCLKYLSNCAIIGVNRGLFTNGCKKVLKYV